MFIDTLPFENTPKLHRSGMCAGGLPVAASLWSLVAFSLCRSYGACGFGDVLSINMALLTELGLRRFTALDITEPQTDYSAPA